MESWKSERGAGPARAVTSRPSMLTAGQQSRERSKWPQGREKPETQELRQGEAGDLSGSRQSIPPSTSQGGELSAEQISAMYQQLVHQFRATRMKQTPWAAGSCSRSQRSSPAGMSRQWQRHYTSSSLAPKPETKSTITFSPLLDSGPSMSALRCTGGAV